MTHQSLLNGLDRLRLSAFRTALEEQLANPQYDPLPFEERLTLLVESRQTFYRVRSWKKLISVRVGVSNAASCFSWPMAPGCERLSISSSWAQPVLARPTSPVLLGVRPLRSRSQYDTSACPGFSRSSGSPRWMDHGCVWSVLWQKRIWLRDPLSLTETQQLLDILDDRYNRSSTLMVSQYPVGDWHLRFQDPTLADAILDRLVHNAHRIELVGESQRKLRSDALKSST